MAGTYAAISETNASLHAAEQTAALLERMDENGAISTVQAAALTGGAYGAGAGLLVGMAVPPAKCVRRNPNQ
jgi:hypothetical protein